ncbi:putative MFS-type transporter [Paramyrothecium foliicola]|nr:putative MFS-type transporter [Paramyrothecium foliicola]
MTPFEQDREESVMPPGTSLLVTDSSALVLVPEPTTDPNDPLNWSYARKVVNVVMVYALTVAVFASLVMQTIFWPQMTVDLGVTFSDLNAGLACNVAGLSIGCIFIVPFTKKYGRRSTYVLSTAVLAGMSWWSSRMTTMAEMLITNFIYGFAGSANETIAEMTIADLFFIHQRGTANGVYIIAVMLGNTLIPTIAGVQAQAQGWRWAYTTVGIVLTVLTFVFVFMFEETSYVPVSVGQRANPSSNNEQAAKTSLEKNELSQVMRAETIESRTGDAERQDNASMPPLNSYRQRHRLISPRPVSLWKCFLSPWKSAMMPHVLYTAIQAANAVAFLVLISSINPIVFSAPPYNFNTAGVGLMQVGPFIGNALGSLYGGIFGDWLVVRMARRNHGVFEPEFRLYVLPLPALMMGAGMVVYGVSLDRGLHWIYPSIGSGMYTFAMGSIMDMCFTMIIDAYKETTAESFTFITFIRNVPTIGLPFGVVPWLASMSLTKVGIISGCVSMTLALLFIPIIVWGKRMRIASAQRYGKLAIEAAAMY